MKSISLDITKAAQFLQEGAVKAFEPQVKAAQEALENGTCQGNDFLGWLHLPSSITPQFISQIEACAQTLRTKCEVIVVAGIGGSHHQVVFLDGVRDRLVERAAVPDARRTAVA
ncbi:MAG TPA: hypothetical protein VIQ97_00315, partial [Prevotella sp.]